VLFVLYTAGSAALKLLLALHTAENGRKLLLFCCDGSNATGHGMSAAACLAVWHGDDDANGRFSRWNREQHCIRLVTTA
jgi:hypothetical protein